MKAIQRSRIQEDIKDPELQKLFPELTAEFSILNEKMPQIEAKDEESKKALNEIRNKFGAARRRVNDFVFSHLERLKQFYKDDFTMVDGQRMLMQSRSIRCTADTIDEAISSFLNDTSKPFQGFAKDYKITYIGDNADGGKDLLVTFDMPMLK